MKHFLEELCIAVLAWIPTAAGMGARLLLWRPLFKRCGRARFGTGIAMQGCKNMSPKTSFFILTFQYFIGCSSMPRAGRWTWARTRP